MTRILTHCAIALTSFLAAGCQTMSASSDAVCRSDASVQAEIDLIARMEEERIAAGVRKDADALEAVTDDSYAQIDFDGRLMDRAATFARIRGPGIRLQSNSIDDMVVKICGDTAVVTGTGHPRGVLDGAEFNPDVRYSRIYLRRNGQWRVVMFQQTRISQGD